MKKQLRTNRYSPSPLPASKSERRQRIQAIGDMIKYLIGDLKELSPGSVVIAEILFYSIVDQVEGYGKQQIESEY